ncbi:AfsR/SARP family transcriptional regulator [Virgisporangium aliadipatigenens]|uniref:AfsR/SARP family transcriptional regulator n=1 Tax=Virgisporangium aliadipatigenens TaxID=741659 RepID=UPI00194487AA|nr:AfsR/SARP family transcriptional regulator [Virgisporangium aliadipatigenens]
MRFLILGPLKVIDGDRAVVLGGRRRRTALAVLLANAGQVVPLEHLIDAMWADPPATARRQIQNEISALRRALAGGTPIDVVGHGYRIAPGPGELDAREFTDLVAKALDLAGRDQPAAAADTLREALRLWRGPALMDLPGFAVEAAAVRLEEQRLAALEQCVDLELGLGRHADLVGELAELVTAHPLRERLVGQLMRALHGSGRQSEALEAYGHLRVRLADELGLQPGTRLRELHGAILRNDPTVRPPAPAPSRTAAAPAPAQLPADVSGFTGRAEHLHRLDALLREERPNAVVISAIAGMAGVGKTTLAVHWGHRVRDRFPDGQLYLDLRGFSGDAPVRPAEALTHLLYSLGEQPEQIPADVQTAAGRYRSLLADRRMLVVLDNAADADQVRPLLPGSAGCVVLITSRNRLPGLVARDGADRLLLDVLTPDEAFDLLATLLGPERVAAEPAATAELARVCSYLPLALRVATAHLLGHPWPGIADYVGALRAGDRLAELDVDGDERSGVRRAFELSYRTLDPDARRLFRLFGLAPGADITVAAAAALGGAGAADTRRRLERLTGANLLDQRVLGRYTCHDLLRDYAAERARAEEPAADRAAALGRLFDWYLHGVDRAARVLYPQSMRLPVPELEVAEPVEPADGTAASAWLDGQSMRLPELEVAGPVEPADGTAASAWLDAERANLVAVIRHAAEHGPRSRAWLLADTLRGYFWLGMHVVDWQNAARTALAAATAEGDLRAQAAAQLSLADSHFRQGEFAPAVERYTASMLLAERTGWAQCEAATIGNLGVIHRDSGQLWQAVEYFDRGLKLCRANDWRHGEAVTLDALARAYLRQGLLEKAGECCARALRINRAIGSRLGEATILGDWGEVLHAQGRLDEAERRLRESLPLFHELGDRSNEAFAMRVLAAVHCDRGSVEDARELGLAALALAREVGERGIEAEALNTLGTIAHRGGRHEDAVGHHEAALELSRAIESRYPEAEALLGLAVAHVALGRHERAVTHARHALAIAGEFGYGRVAELSKAVIDRS